MPPVTSSTKISEAFDSFMRMVHPDGCGCQQSDDLRMAFYGGATALFHALQAGVSEGGGEATDADVDLISSLEAELHAYVASLPNGDTPS